MQGHLEPQIKKKMYSNKNSKLRSFEIVENIFKFRSKTAQVKNFTTQYVYIYFKTKLPQSVSAFCAFIL